MKTIFLTMILAVFTGVTNGNCQSKEKTKRTKSNVDRYPSAIYCGLNLVKGQKLADIYSLTISFWGEDFEPQVTRVSGNTNYMVEDNDPNALTFSGTDWYDGDKPTNFRFKTDLSGKSTANGKVYSNTNASGLLYNESIWGKIPAFVKEGAQWKFQIPQPWELGGMGEEVITVIALDAAHHTITLKREGNSEGFSQSDKKVITITLTGGKKTKMNIQPGRSHWVGLTTFQNSVVLSDELLVTRPVSLSNDSVTIKANERQYILLNAMPLN